ncbi:hypothetical protein AGMMS49938_03910 [Fibrobacterales bacterium]|nr:hypothetical protein AGMMS49938_03910 [Fibrobacterales bacterium]
MMNVNVEYAKSAFKHGVTEADILWAFKTVEYDAVLEDLGMTDKNLLIGFDKNANLIEILYKAVDEDSVVVFHAMKCRPAFVTLLK